LKIAKTASIVVAASVVVERSGPNALLWLVRDWRAARSVRLRGTNGEWLNAEDRPLAP